MVMRPPGKRAFMATPAKITALTVEIAAMRAKTGAIPKTRSAAPIPPSEIAPPSIASVPLAVRAFGRSGTGTQRTRIAARGGFRTPFPMPARTSGRKRAAAGRWKMRIQSGSA
jgi:hypothetical protein